MASTVSRPSVLQRVGVQLVGQADAAAFLAEVEQHAFAGLVDHLHGGVELVAAVAARAAEDVAGQAFAVDADEDGLVVGDWLAGVVELADAALAQRQVRLRVDGALVGVQPELAPLGREGDRSIALDELLALAGGS